MIIILLHNIYLEKISQNCIDIFNSLFKNDKYRRTLKIKNHSIWTVIMQTVEKFHLKVILHKVKTHSNLMENDMADQLAKDGCHLPHPILINPKTLPTVAVPTWNDSLHINQDVRKWANIPIQSRTFNEMCSLKKLSPLH